jgi:hypothetical protein
MKTSNESGYIIVMVAIFLIALLAVTALAIDIGLSYAARTQNQAAADAAALAGAFTFTDSTLAQPNSAQDRATKTAIANKTMGNAITAPEVNAIADMTNRRVTVTITRTERTFFSKVIGFNSLQVQTTAVAEASPYATGGPCMKPIFIPNTLGTLAPCGPMGACMTGKVLLNASHNETTYAASIRGQEFTMKPQSPGGALNPSDFYEIVLGNGGNDYRDAVGGCITDASVYCQMDYNVLTGNKKGPTKDGINTLIGNPPTDTYVGVGQYRHSDGNIYTTSRALVSAPIVDLCNYPMFCPSGALPPGGNPILHVIGFATVFVESVGQNGPGQGDVLARFIGAYGCAASPPATGSPGGAPPLPIRLVRTQ